MSFANAVCPPHAWDAFSTGFMFQIKPQVEFKINLKCVEPSGSCGYSLRMETRSVQRQIKDALKEKKLTQSKLAELCKVSDNAVSNPGASEAFKACMKSLLSPPALHHT